MFNKFKRLLLNKTTELVVFTVFVLLNASFLLLFEFIHSLDGPQHIYNSTVIFELIKGNANFAEFFNINPVIVGYWTGPFLLTLFNSFLPANVAMKILIFICLAGVAYSFRYLVYSIRKQTTYLTLLIIPFSVHTYLTMGYYTFSIAWIFFFLTLAFYIRNYENLKFKQLVILCLLISLSYLSHMVVFSFAMACLVLLVIFQFIQELFRKKKGVLKKYTIIAVKILTVSLPAVTLATIYSLQVFEISSKFKQSSLPNNELSENLINLKNLISFDNNQEALLGRIMFITLLSTMVYLIVQYIFVSIKDYRISKTYPTISWINSYWFFVVLLTLIFYLSMPNTFGTGAISTRILVLFYFVLIVWLCLQKYQWIVVAIILSVMLYTGVERRNIATLNLQYLNSDAQEVSELAKYMEPNSVYYALNYSEYWTHLNICCYAGADKALIYILNPQCQGQFPVVWSKNLPCSFLGNSSAKDLHRKWFTSGTDKPIKIIDYVIVWGYGAYLYESNSTKQTMDKYYRLVATSKKGNAALYEFKFKKVLQESLQKMKETPEWYAQLQEKAKVKNIPVENVMLMDAFYLLELYSKY